MKHLFKLSILVLIVAFGMACYASVSVFAAGSQNVQISDTITIEETRVDYNIDYYTESLNGTYEVTSTVTGSGRVGETITASTNLMQGFTLNLSHSSSLISKTLVFNDNNELRVYYNRNSYIATYQDPHGIGNNTVTYKYDEDVDLPDLLHSGYTFDAWFYNGNAVSSLSMPAENIILDSSWIVNQYTITYEGLNGVSNTNPTKYTVLSSTITFVDPGDRNGYLFDGWFDAAIGGNLITVLTTGSFGDLILYAQWQEDVPVINISGTKFNRYFVQEDYYTGLNAALANNMAGILVGVDSTRNIFSGVTAADNKGNNLTGSITYTSSPAFDPTVAGTYEITFNVSNYGILAEPVTFKIIVWNFVKMMSGRYHTLALTSDGTVYSWGYNIDGQQGDGTTTRVLTPKVVGGALSGKKIVDIATSYSDGSYALTDEGLIYVWGLGGNYQLGNGSTSRQTSPVLATMPTLEANEKFITISAGYYSAGAVTNQGRVYVWGDKSNHRLGLGSNSGTQNTPTLLTGLNGINIKQLNLGRFSGAAVTNDGAVYVWGDGSYGGLGLGNTTNQSTPVLLDSLSNIKQIAVGYYYMVAIDNSGQVYTWGNGDAGRLGTIGGSTSNKTTPQAIGITNGAYVETIYHSTTVLTTDGKVYMFGNNDYGKHGSGNSTNHTEPYQVRLPPINSPTYITDATYTSIALDTAFVLVRGTLVYGSGWNGDGQIGSGNTTTTNLFTSWAFTPPVSSRVVVV